MGAVGLNEIRNLCVHMVMAGQKPSASSFHRLYTGLSHPAVSSLIWSLLLVMAGGYDHTHTCGGFVGCYD